jgi:hypothetical protein
MPNLYLPTQLQTNVLIWGLVAHVVGDWLLQNEWMAQHKSDLRHPAGWVHGAIHAVCLLWLMPWPLALLVGLSHVVIDTRAPVQWWMRVVKGMSPATAVYDDLVIWMDQMFHVMVLVIVVLLFV